MFRLLECVVGARWVHCAAEEPLLARPGGLPHTTHLKLWPLLLWHWREDYRPALHAVNLHKIICMLHINHSDCACYIVKIAAEKQLLKANYDGQLV